MKFTFAEPKRTAAKEANVTCFIDAISETPK